MKKIFIFLTFGSLLLACNDTATNEITSDAAPSEENVIGAIEDGIVNTEEANTSVPTKTWQINNYVTFILDKPVAASAEEMNANHDFKWFYQVLDVQGGFASVTGPIEGWKEFVVWKMENGDDLVGTMTVGCGPACDYKYTFYKGLGSAVHEIDLDEVIPVNELEKKLQIKGDKLRKKYKVEYPEDQVIVYNLPQKGTSMQVDVILGADEERVPMATLSWNKKEFSIKNYLGDFVGN